jgi:hypothetical protein
LLSISFHLKLSSPFADFGGKPPPTAGRGQVGFLLQKIFFAAENTTCCCFRGKTIPDAWCTSLNIDFSLLIFDAEIRFEISGQRYGTSWKIVSDKCRQMSSNAVRMIELGN